MNNYLIRFFCVFILFTSFVSCENKLEMTLPQGPKGDKGDKGEPGLSAFDLWKEYYGKDPNTSIEDFFNSLKGKDGKDGAVPIIGDNGNWIIDGVDTGILAKGKDGKNGVTPEIGSNGNWYIDGVDTGVPARGPKGDDGEDGNDGDKGDNGVDGKSAYELWKEAVDLCDGTVKNKDGSPYDCTKNTWEDFLIWLQGGDFSVLHQYWLGKGNEGDLEAFLEALFDCHCDGITIIVVANNECVELNPDGTLKKPYKATVKVGGKAGTSVVVAEEDGSFSWTGTIPPAGTEASFEIDRTYVARSLTLNCTEPGASEQITKTATIPALKYIKLADETPVSVTKVVDEEKDNVSISFATAPATVSVGSTVIYNGTETQDGWVRSEDGKTFTKTYDRKENKESFKVVATGENGECSTLDNLFEIPQLTPVAVGDPSLAILNSCELTLSISGTSGMTVKASYGTSPVTIIELDENPAGSGAYSAVIPRTYSAYTVTVTAEKTGSGTATKTIQVTGANLQEVTNPLIITNNSEDNPEIALLQKRLTNNTAAPLKVTIKRGDNTISGSNRHALPTFPIEQTIPANGYIDINFNRDYTPTFQAGRYTVTITTENECGLTKNYQFNIDNQTNYRSKFTRPDGFGGEGQPGGPDWNYETDGDPNITFTVEVFDAIPNSYIEFQLFKGVGYSAVLRKQAGTDGYLTENVTLKASELAAALANEKGFFKFFSDADYTSAYNIGATKEQVTFAF